MSRWRATADTHMGTPEIAPGGYPPAHARSVHASATSGTAAMPQKLTKLPPFEHFSPDACSPYTEKSHPQAFSSPSDWVS